MGCVGAACVSYCDDGAGLDRAERRSEHLEGLAHPDGMARQAEVLGHGVEVVEPLKVQSKAKDWMTAWDQIWPFPDA